MNALTAIQKLTALIESNGGTVPHEIEQALNKPAQSLKQIPDSAELKKAAKNIAQNVMYGKHSCN